MSRTLALLPLAALLAACQQSLPPANYGPDDQGIPIPASLLVNTPLATPGAFQPSAGPAWTVATPPAGGCPTVIHIVDSSTPLGAVPGAFDPPNPTLKAGQCVTWVNQTKATHTATDRGGAFDTSLMAAGASVSLTARAGTYSYFCVVHPGMTAGLVVSGS